MPDPFLLAHLVSPLCFEIGGLLSPISIRDQMIRGRLVVDRGLEAGLIGGELRPLLVIGAGAAGATAAMRAAERGVQTVLIDRALGPFSRQAGCLSRWIDPTQYDWPVDHWQTGRFPWTGPSMSLPWSAAHANMLAIVWTNELNRARLAFGPARLSVYYDTYLHTSPALGANQMLMVRPSRKLPLQSFGMVVSSIGFGTENCTLGRFSGFRFWDTDAFEEDDLGLPDLEKPRVLISGGGDGALQDFIRIVTGVRSARMLFGQLSIPGNLKAEIESRIQSAEDQAQRAYIWGTGNHDHFILECLQKEHIEQIQKLAANPANWNNLVDTLDGIVRPADDPEVELVHPCSHFGRCYGLNRFLVLLLARYLDEKRKDEVSCIQGSTKVARISSTSAHTCFNNPSNCYGEEHLVVFDSSTCPGVTASSPAKNPSNCHIVVLRHGVSPPLPVFGPPSSPVRHPRQTIPYYSPW